MTPDGLGAMIVSSPTFRRPLTRRTTALLTTVVLLFVRSLGDIDQSEGVDEVVVEGDVDAVPEGGFEGGGVIGPRKFRSELGCRGTRIVRKRKAAMKGHRRPLGVGFFDEEDSQFPIADEDVAKFVASSKGRRRNIVGPHVAPPVRLTVGLLKDPVQPLGMGSDGLIIIVTSSSVASEGPCSGS